MASHMCLWARQRKSFNPTTLARIWSYWRIASYQTMCTKVSTVPRYGKLHVPLVKTEEELLSHHPVKDMVVLA
jgi:hypothetical protein